MAEVKPKAEEPAARSKTVALARLPLRRIVQIGLGVVIVTGVAYGSYKTLTLDAGEGRLSGETWRDFVIFGLARGSIYALIAIGYSLVYGILLMINFAHGEVFMVGAFASFFVAREFSQSGFLDSNPVVAIVALLFVSILISMAVAVLLERVAYRPLRGSPRLVPLITAVGASLFLQNTARGFFGPQTRGYPKPNALDGSWDIFGVPVARPAVLVIVTAVAGMIALSLFIARTRTGRAMRAVSEDKEIASVMGIDVDRTIVKTFAIGGLMAGVAGVMFALLFEKVDPFMGFIPGIKAFTAAVLGGIGSIAGAALGGLILGLSEAVMPFLLLNGFDVPSPSQLTDVVAFSILVLVLIYKPGGILGTGEQEKV